MGIWLTMFFRKFDVLDCTIYIDESQSFWRLNFGYIYRRLQVL
jgi:hypothetical protein